MPTDTNHAEATAFLDRAAQILNREKGAPLDTVAQVGIGYAILALVDEVDELRKQLRQPPGDWSRPIQS